MENYYALLGVSVNSSPEEIKRKFRQIQLQLHSNNDSNSIIKDNYDNICTAYKILSNMNLKEQYDKTINREIIIKDDHVAETLNNTKAVDMFSVIGEHLLNNVMKNITNVDTHIMPPSNMLPINNVPSIINPPSMSNPTHATEPLTIPPIVQVFPVTFLQAYKGCVLPIEIERKVYTNDATTSFVTENETIYINIPKGIDNNEILFFPDKGDIVGNQQGELKVNIKLTAHDMYLRDGLDLVYIKHLTLKESLCGTTFNIEHFNNKSFKISTHGHVVNPTNQQRIPELGFQRMDCSPIGDLVVKFEIIFPESLSQECTDTLSEILP